MRRPLRKVQRRRVAFTLIEVLVAVALLAIVLPVVMGGISLALNVASSARRASLAATLARAKLDELATNGMTGGDASGDFGDAGAGFTWSATSQAWDTSGVTRIDVRVGWTDRAHPRSTSMTTLVYGNGGTP